jgi:hypothetical protein
MQAVSHFPRPVFRALSADNKVGVSKSRHDLSALKGKVTNFMACRQTIPWPSDVAFGSPVTLGTMSLLGRTCQPSPKAVQQCARGAVVPAARLYFQSGARAHEQTRSQNIVLFRSSNVRKSAMKIHASSWRCLQWPLLSNEEGAGTFLARSRQLTDPDSPMWPASQACATSSPRYSLRGFPKSFARYGPFRRAPGPGVEWIHRS